MPSDKRARQRAGRAARMAELQRAQQRRRRNTRTIPIITAVVVVALGLALATGLGGGSGKKKVSTTGTTTAPTATTNASATTAPGTTPPTAAPVTAGSITGATPCPPLDGSAKHVVQFAQVPPTCITAGKTYTATIDTTEGNVVVKFDTTKTPNTANNFVVLAAYHYFDGTALFRTDTSIGIIQGGSPHTQSASDPGPGYTIADEGKGFTYQAGDLVMARTGAPNSAGSQFFFCATSACSNLNSQGTYVVFAHTTSGLDVLQKILNLNVDTNTGLGGAPKTLVLIKSISLSAS